MAPPRKNTTGLATPNDTVMTPPAVAERLVRHFQPSGLVLEPCRGTGNIYQALLAAGCATDWCEISEGRDFFDYTGPRPNLILTNPPYSIFPTFLGRCLSICDDVIVVIPPAKLFASLTIMAQIRQFGGISEICLIGGGGKLGFPFGFPVAACRIKRGPQETRNTVLP